MSTPSRTSRMALGAYGELRSMEFAPPGQGPWGSDAEVLDAWTTAIMARLGPATHLLRVDPPTGPFEGPRERTRRSTSSAAGSTIGRMQGLDYRADQVGEATAKSFLTFLGNRDDEQARFVDRSWNGKHNLGIHGLAPAGPSVHGARHGLQLAGRSDHRARSGRVRLDLEPGTPLELRIRF